LPEVKVTPRIQSRRPGEKTSMFCHVIGEPFPEVHTHIHIYLFINTEWPRLIGTFEENILIKNLLRFFQYLPSNGGLKTNLIKGIYVKIDQVRAGWDGKNSGVFKSLIRIES